MTTTTTGPALAPAAPGGPEQAPEQAPERATVTEAIPPDGSAMMPADVVARWPALAGRGTFAALELPADHRLGPYTLRAVGYGVQYVEDLLAHPLNWRMHPPSQYETLGAVIRDVGYVRAILVNARTGRMLDGHARAVLAGQDGQAVLPAEYVDVPEELEAEILLTLDPLAELAHGNAAAVDHLLRGVLSDEPDVQAFLASVADGAGALPLYGDADPGDEDGEADQPGAPAAAAPGAATVDGEAESAEAEQAGEADPDRFWVMDVIFPTDNPWDIPLLDIRRQALELPAPVTRWGRFARHGGKTSMPGTWHFYTEDYKFTAIWRDPAAPLRAGAAALVEPNLSTGGQTPGAYALWTIYQKRWIARWWQERGRRILVDLNVSPEFDEINLMGVPQGWRAYATRGHDRMLELLNRHHTIATCHAGMDDVLFLVVGGGLATRRLCGERGWIHVPQEAHDIEGRYQDGER